jgi:hypothetical protein
MATLLTANLKNSADNDSIFHPLYAQWSFDEPLAAKALQNVSAWFPHYSRHDASHARQILVHIERLLGEENIAKLSATDTWLILESAYFHDIGMVVTINQAIEDFNSDDFRKHLESLRSKMSSDELQAIEALLSLSDYDQAASSLFSLGFSLSYTVKLLRDVQADFYRAKHHDRAEAILAKPVQELGLNSPRTELIPARLFGLLGRICSHHGKSFDEVMRLPMRQVGIGRDDCHPRFVACLLRLGDLLDLDDNRFCPVMLRMGGSIPLASKAHIDKHAAIRHFRADRRRIEIDAECESYDGYIATTQWFSWLREEVQRQMGQWDDIVPSRNFGLLPSVVFSENERPHFALDSDRVFDLLRGAGLYENREQAMRELLQNAVDATLIRAWIEHGEDRASKTTKTIRRTDNPHANHVWDVLGNYPIEVSMHKKLQDEKYNYWEIVIADQGVGISEEDFR